jgi:hypothetical protein
VCVCVCVCVCVVVGTEPRAVHMLSFPGWCLPASASGVAGTATSMCHCPLAHSSIWYLPLETAYQTMEFKLGYFGGLLLLKRDIK